MIYRWLGDSYDNKNMASKLIFTLKTSSADLHVASLLPPSVVATNSEKVDEGFVNSEASEKQAGRWTLDLSAVPMLETY